MNMNNGNCIDHTFGTGSTTDFRFAGCNPRFASYKDKMTEKLFNRWIKPDVSSDRLSYKSVRVLSFNDVLYRITLRKKVNRNHEAKVEKMLPTTGWISILNEDDLNDIDFKEYTDGMNKIFDDKSVRTAEDSDYQNGYSWMDDVENDFISSIILLFN